MKQPLTAGAFAGLLDILADTSDAAGEKYEEMRRVLIKFFEWRGAPFPDEHADETLNRVARKIDEGIEIKNISAYCHEVARYVYLEAIKSRDAKHSQLDDGHQGGITMDTTNEKDENERRLACLDKCLAVLPETSGELIIEYYKNGEASMIEHRRALAERLGLKRDALANRIQRLRNRLEHCVKKCVRQ